MAKIIEEAFDLTQESSDVTQADTTAAEWGDLFLYQCPTGTSLVLKPTDTISMYIKETDGTAMADNMQVKIEVRDSTQSDKKTPYGPALYKTVQEFQDQRKMARLQISPTDGVIHIREKMYIAIMVKSGASYGADKDTSYFDLATTRVRQTL